jgi:ubiquinone/menaquinone biosynthesis C-methylase UbiE
MTTFFYFLGIFLELAFLIFFCVYIVSITYSALKGAFYVATNQKEIDLFLKEAQLKKGQYFLELGSGDGRVLRTAAKKYGVVGKGIDINPSLNWIANFLAKRKNLENIEFVTENVKKTDFSKADIIYVFLMPKLIRTFEKKLLEESKKNVLVITHGFNMHSMDKYLVKTINRKPFSTFFYRKTLSSSKKTSSI